MRKSLGLVLVALGALVAILVTGVSAQKGPIKIGFIVSLTGPFAPNGKDMANAFEMYLDEHKYRLAGREVKLITEDDEGKPATGLTKARGLVESQNVHVIVGPISAAIGYAIAPYVDGKKVPTIFPIVSSEDITQRKRSNYIVRTGWSSSQPSHPFGKWAYENLKYRKIAIIGYDFAFGWEVAAGFHRTFEEAGGQVVQKLWSPINTPDYGPYLAQLRRDVDAVYCVFSGADALRFSKQYADAGLKERIPLIGAQAYRSRETAQRSITSERRHHPAPRSQDGNRIHDRQDPMSVRAGLSAWSARFEAGAHLLPRSVDAPRRGALLPPKSAWFCG